MGAKITRKGDTFTVETDTPAGGTEQKLIQNDNQLKGAMRLYNVDKVETEYISGGSVAAVHDEFNRQFKKKTGSETGYTFV